MGKWIAAVVAVLVLGGAGFAVYKLTNIPEQAKDWWDDKKLDNFETLANRELEAMEGKISGLNDTLHQKKVERVLWAGDEKLGDKNTTQQKDTGFKTLLGYNKLISWRTDQGKVLAAAYSDAAKAAGVAIDGGKSDLKEDTAISVDTPTQDGAKNHQDLTAKKVLDLLGQIETELTVLETEKKGVEGVVAKYDELIVSMEKKIGEMGDTLKDMRQQVKVIAAKIKVDKVNQDLNELNKSINGQGGKSELGDMIGKYEQRKTKMEASDIVDAEKKGSATVSLTDLDKPSTTATKSSRFLK